MTFDLTGSDHSLMNASFSFRVEFRPTYTAVSYIIPGHLPRVVFERTVKLREFLVCAGEFDIAS